MNPQLRGALPVGINGRGVTTGVEERRNCSTVETDGRGNGGELPMRGRHVDRPGHLPGRREN